jgi:hypothetical protein
MDASDDEGVTPMPPLSPTLSVAHEVRAIAQELIREHHAHLLEANLLYVFTDQRRKRCDRVRLGSAAKMNAMLRFLASGMDSVEDGPDFLILISSDEWSELGLQARKALVDHELSHCALFVKDDSEKPAVWVRWDAEMGNPDSYPDRRWGMRGHDLEEFAGVLKRHGFWRADPQEREFEQIAIQTVMPMLPQNGAARSERTAAGRC